MLLQWLTDCEAQTLLAIDAPLGWPAELSTSLIDHTAGKEIPTEPNRMFRRATDRFVQAKLGKTPLDVGADRIARTAHSALALLGGLRKRLGKAIPLAWNTDINQLCAIEVYPAATLIARGIPANGYKRTEQMAERQNIIENLRADIDLSERTLKVHGSPDALDAAICVLAGGDFLRKRALGPDPAHRALAEKEGWIWFPPRKGRGCD
jgi:predicted nuclease with RNAse H fold